MRYLRSISYSLLVFFILVISLLAFIFSTTPGLYLVIKVSSLALPGQLKVKKLEGSLLHAFSFARLDYQSNDLNLSITDGQFIWHAKALWKKKILIKQIKLNEISVNLKKTTSDSKNAQQPVFGLPKLPINIDLQDVSIQKLALLRPDSTTEINRIHIKAQLNPERWDVNLLNATYAGMIYSLAAKLQPDPPFHLSALVNIKPTSQAAFPLRGQIQVGGDLNLYHWRGKFSGQVSGSMHGTLQHGKGLTMQLQWDHLTLPINANLPLTSNQGKVKVLGQLPNISITADTELTQPVQGHLTAKSSFKPDQIQLKTKLSLAQGTLSGHFLYDQQAKPQFSGELKTNHLTLQSFNIPLSELESHTSFSGNGLDDASVYSKLSARYQEHLLKAAINYHHPSLSADLSLGPNHLTLQGALPYQWQAKLNIPQPAFLHPALKGLHTTISANAELNSPKQGQLHLTMQPGIYQNPNSNVLPPVKFQGGQIIIQLSPNALAAKGELAIDQLKTMDIQFKLPQFTLNHPNAQQAIDGKISMNINHLDFLNGVSPLIEKIRGQLKLDLDVTGNVQKPTLTGAIVLNNASAFVPKLNLTLNPIDAKLTTENKQWQVQANLTSKGKTLSIQGSGTFIPEKTGKIEIQGDHFPIMQTAEYEVNITPQLTFNFKPNTYDLTGTVFIPSANLKPITFSNSQELTSDAVFASEKDESTPLDLSANIKVSMGKDVALDIKGLKGFLDGAIELTQAPRSELMATGELSIRDGKYHAYGQDLVIEEGQLLFAGGSITNPGIRLKAVRYFKNASANLTSSDQWFDFSSGNIDSINISNKTTVGIELTGRIQNPQIKLFSNPANMSQADILSMLLLGRPASQASKSGGQLLLTAISGMNLNSGTKGVQLVDQLKQSTGLDFDIQSSSQFNRETNQVSESTSFVVGKAINKRLYISYNIGLLQEDGNVLTLKYILNKFFSIQVTASDIGTGIDLMYTHAAE